MEWGKKGLVEGPSNVISYPTLYFTLRERLLSPGLRETQSHWEHLAVSLPLEPSRGDGWPAANVTVFASSSVFRQIKISFLSTDDDCRCPGIANQFRKCELGGLHHHSSPPPGKTVLTPQRGLLPGVSERAQSPGLGFKQKALEGVGKGAVPCWEGGLEEEGEG